LSLDTITTPRWQSSWSWVFPFFSIIFICIHKWIGLGQIILDVYAICK
jgi:succinate dehydrogenase hydrophobic anchor subunit